MMLGQMRGWEWLIVIALSVVPAIIPIAIAYGRRTTNRVAVLIVALLTSWTCVGWVIAVVLAAVGKPETKAPGARE
jgi:hypothetical protein